MKKENIVYSDSDNLDNDELLRFLTGLGRDEGIIYYPGGVTIHKKTHGDQGSKIRIELCVCCQELQFDKKAADVVADFIKSGIKKFISSKGLLNELIEAKK